MKNSDLLLLTAALIGFFAGCSSRDSNPVKSQQILFPSVEVIDVGIHLFNDKCMPCHGMDGTAGILHAANLQTIKLDRVSILRTITQGKNAMPAFEYQLSTAEIELITNYVIRLKK